VVSIGQSRTGGLFQTGALQTWLSETWLSETWLSENWLTENWLTENWLTENWPPRTGHQELATKTWLSSHRMRFRGGHPAPQTPGAAFDTPPAFAF
jgi:hypothetical protein